LAERNGMKKLLYLFLTEKAYLRTLHRFFYFLFDLGLLKKKEEFKYHYFVKRIIKPHFIVIDIGANLGYFAKNFSNLAKRGKIIAIEPLPQFHEVLKYFIGMRDNVELHNVALGKDAGTITMVLPRTNGMLRTGLPHIMRPEEKSTMERTQDVQMVNTTDFFNTFEHIDYIKCDIEGHEWEVFQLLEHILQEKRPFVQLEIDPVNQQNLLTFFSKLNYLCCGLDGLVCKVITEKHFGGDYLFVPSEKQEIIAQWNA
jgi:FkbM family methyltransferase